MKMIAATVLERINPAKLHREYEGLPLKQIYRKKKVLKYLYSVTANITFHCYLYSYWEKNQYWKSY